MMLPSDQFSSHFDQALTLASMVHDGMRRKGTLVPYITHPVHVARLLDRHGFSEDVVIAGLLHDVLEDARFGDASLQAALRCTFSQFANTEPSEAAFRDDTEAFIEAKFGNNVLELVRFVTEDKTHSWRVRKDRQLGHIPEMTRDQAALKAADGLHNCRSSLSDIQRDGLNVFQRFDCSIDDTLWFLGASTDALRRHVLAGHPLQLELDAAAFEFIEEVNRLRADPAAVSRS
jgi:(p)ppGpp synthase/HD superfamily hydrolase